MTMTMAIIFLALQFTIPNWTTKEWKMQSFQNYEDINDNIIIDNYDILASDI